MAKMLGILALAVVPIEILTYEWYLCS